MPEGWPSFSPGHLRLLLRIERKVEQENSFKTGREGLKKWEIEKRYSTEKAKQLMDLLKSRNLFYYDEDFPGDEEDMGSKTSQNITTPW